METDRTKNCDCWAKLDYCPVNCESDLSTPNSAKQIDVQYEEVRL